MATQTAMQRVLRLLTEHFQRHGTLTEADITRLQKQAQKGGGEITLVDLRAAAPRYLAPFLRLRPVRTASGVAVVAVMCAPHRCPHEATTGAACIYCPGGPSSEDFVHSSQSYTGREPTSLRAINARYSPSGQVRSRIGELTALGHDTSKIELILMGGTFMALEAKYRDWFIHHIHDAISGVQTRSLRAAICAAEHAPRSRCIGLTIETRPDYCLPGHISDMLAYGTTRLEVGLQSTFDDVIRECNRGHTLRSAHRCFGQVREAGFKLTVHMMPNLPRTPVRRDVWGFADLFSHHRYVPDGLKIYPTLIMAGTELKRRYDSAAHQVYPPAVLSALIQEIFALCPPWTRAYRVQRDIPPELILDGAESAANARDVALARLREQARPTAEIRTREDAIRTIHAGRTAASTRAGVAARGGVERGAAAAAAADGWGSLAARTPQVVRTDYVASGRWETFFAMQDAQTNSITGLLRLRQTRGADSACRHEFRRPTSLVREVHVYGSATGVNTAAVRAGAAAGAGAGGRVLPAQHAGVGAALLAAAESVASSEHASVKMSIISGVGVRNYYAKFGYELDGPYMSRDIVPQPVLVSSDAANHDDCW